MADFGRVFFLRHSAEVAYQSGLATGTPEKILGFSFSFAICSYLLRGSGVFKFRFHLTFSNTQNH